VKRYFKMKDGGYIEQWLIYILMPRKKHLKIYHVGWGETYPSDFPSSPFRNNKTGEPIIIVDEKCAMKSIFCEIPENEAILEMI